MDHPKQRHGNHTWDRVLDYHRCPECGYVMENRDKFERRFESALKEIICPRCRHCFIIKKLRKTQLGPLLGHDPHIDE